MIPIPDADEPRMQPNKAADARRRRAEAWTFFRQWLRRPLSTAAVSPSSRFLARRIVSALPPGTERVIELGAGTGTFTRAMLESGIDSVDLLAVEFNPELHLYLGRHFPGLNVVRADARFLHESTEIVGFAKEKPVQAIVSGLGLLSMSRSMQRSVLEGAFSLLPAGGCFVQFTYGPSVPVAGEVLRDLGLRAERHGFTLLNLPPASIYILTRSRSIAVPGTRTRAA